MAGQEISKTCCFFGHKDAPERIKPELAKSITNLIEEDGVNTFYVGNQGQYDAMVLSVLKELSAKYSNISYCVVLAYMPDERSNLKETNTLYPDGIETVPKRFCISWRNNWLIEHSNYVICYVTHLTGGAVQFVEKAKKKEKIVINIYQPEKIKG